MKTRILILLTCSAVLLSAQTLPNPNEDLVTVTKVIRVHGNANALAGLVMSGHAVVRQSNELQAIVVSGRAADVESVERTIRELDGLSAPAPSIGRDVEVTAYVIAGSAEPIAGTSEVTGDLLGPVVRQLKAIFPYSHYQLLNTTLLRAAQNAKASIYGVMKSLVNTPERPYPITYQIRYDSAKVLPGPVSSISLTNLRFSTRIPVMIGGSGSFQNVDANIETDDVTLREGQKIVVGKTNVGNADTCFFLVLTARLVQ